MQTQLCSLLPSDSGYLCHFEGKMDELTEEKSTEGSRITAGSERSFHHKWFTAELALFLCFPFIFSHHLPASSDYSSQI